MAPGSLGRATKETYGSAVAADMAGGNGAAKKHPSQICGYPLPRSGGAQPAAGCDLLLCMLPWQRCDKHLNWENHKRQELKKEQYVLDRCVSMACPCHLSVPFPCLCLSRAVEDSFMTRRSCVGAPRHVEALRVQEEAIQSRMRRRLQQLVDGDAKGSTTASS